MKKIIQKIVAGLLSLAMILGGFWGTGFETGATEVSEYPTTLKVRVEDEKGNPVSGVQLCLAYENKNYPNQNMKLDFSEVTKEGSGEATYSCEELTDFETEVPYYMLQSEKDESGVSKYEFNESIRFTLGYDWNEEFVYIDTIKIGEGEEIFFFFAEHDRTGDHRQPHGLSESFIEAFDFPDPALRRPLAAEDFSDLPVEFVGFGGIVFVEFFSRDSQKSLCILKDIVNLPVGFPYDEYDRVHVLGNTLIEHPGIVLVFLSFFHIQVFFHFLHDVLL